MKISEVMTRQVEVASPEQSIQEAASLMAQLDSGVLPVGENDRLVGMLTDRDITVRAVAEGKDPRSTRVREVMTPDIKYCFEDDDVDEVSDNMAQLQVRRLPVVNRDKRLTGIVSLGDIARRNEPHDTGEALRGISQPGGQHNQSQPS